MFFVRSLGLFAIGLAVLFAYSEWRHHRAVNQAKREKGRG